jgi:hypothetical protein
MPPKPIKKPGIKKVKMPARKGVRSSNRVKEVVAPRKAAETPIDNGVLYVDKLRDGRESKRKAASLQAQLELDGPMVYEKLPATNKVLAAVNGRRRRSREGKQPCYDVMDDLGSSIYGYSLPLTLMAGLLQGLKSKDAVKTFKNETATLASHKNTTYMFLHWQENKGERLKNKDYKLHKFVAARPGLETAIESLGNTVSRQILLNPAIGEGKFPGMLSNKAIGTTADQDFQEPHWDFLMWRFIKAEFMPWIVHVPLCREGMMLHVWPTERDQATHTLKVEKLRLGTPKLVYVAFGDYLLLRADVCHGGCFGSVGNFRFHMVLRHKDCNLESRQLHLLGWSGVDRDDYKRKLADLSKLLGDRGSRFKEEQKKKEKSTTAYKTALETTVYPNYVEWVDGLLANLEYPKEEEIMEKEE